MITSKRTFVQSFSSSSVFIFNRDFNRFFTRLQRKPLCGDLLLVGCTHQNTTLAVCFGFVPLWMRIPLRLGTFPISGSIRLKRGENVTETG